MDITPEFVRKFAGGSPYTPEMAKREPERCAFLRFVERVTPAPDNPPDYAYQKIRDASDEQVVMWYMAFLMEGKK